MSTIFQILTILNTLAILFYFVYKSSPRYFTITKVKTFHFDTTLGYKITLWEKQNGGATSIFSFTIPIHRNIEQIKINEEIRRISGYTHQNKLQTLSAMFSHLKTDEEVSKFVKNYSVIDPIIVNKLYQNHQNETF